MTPKADSRGFRSNDVRQSSTRAQGEGEAEKRSAENSAPKDLDTMFNLSSRQNFGYQDQKDKTRSAMSEDSSDSMDEAPQRRRKGKTSSQQLQPLQGAAGDETGQDLTYLSFLDVRFPFYFPFQ